LQSAGMHIDAYADPAAHKHTLLEFCRYLDQINTVGIREHEHLPTDFDYICAGCMKLVKANSK
jgi:hypothetical protein